MRFLDREAELAFLEGCHRSRGAQLVVLWGRRRVGKTAILRQFAERHGVLYHVATRATPQLELERFSPLPVRLECRDGGAPCVSTQRAVIRTAHRAMACRAAARLGSRSRLPEEFSRVVAPLRHPRRRALLPRALRCTAVSRRQHLPSYSGKGLGAIRRSAVF